MANAKVLPNKRALTPDKISAITTFWQTVNQAKFITTDNVSIAYAVNFTSANRPYVVIVPGRSESYLKYQELAYDLHQEGFDSVVIDHRGQGLSQRLLANRFQGYVKKFDDYAQDLHQLISQVLPTVHPKKENAPLMLAHSMGGAIALRYLQKYKNNIKALTLSSPMIAISSGSAPSWLAKFIVKTGNNLNHLLSGTPWYFLGQNDINQTSFEDNKLMHCKARFERFKALYNSQPELKLGGVTFHWLSQALAANQHIFRDIGNITQPVLVLQASDEYIVDNVAQNAFIQKLSANNSTSDKLQVITGAYHELFFELDEYRDIALNSAIAWFSKTH